MTNPPTEPTPVQTPTDINSGLLGNPTLIDPLTPPSVPGGMSEEDVVRADRARTRRQRTIMWAARAVVAVII